MLNLESNLKGNCEGIFYSNGLDQPDVMLKLFTLLYADDTILLSESITDLQNMLNILNDYCKRWHLTVNAEKTKDD